MPETNRTCQVGDINLQFLQSFIHKMYSDLILPINNGSDATVNVCAAAFQSRNKLNTAWAPIYASAFTQQSSRRYKTHISDMDDAMGLQVLQYHVVNYDYINAADGTNCQGMIAEEVEEINPYPVVYDSDGRPEGLDYSKFIPQLIKMAQIQQAEIDNLRQHIAELERLVTEIRFS